MSADISDDVLSKLKRAREALASSASLTEGFSGADIEAACRQAAVSAMLDSVKNKRRVSMNDLRQALKDKKALAAEWLQLARGLVPTTEKSLYAPIFKEENTPGGMYG